MRVQRVPPRGGFIERLYQQEQRSLCSRARAPESGMGLAELVIVLPIAILLISGLIDLGIALHQTELASDISRSAARTAAIVTFEDDFYPPQDPRPRYSCPPPAFTPSCEADWSLFETSINCASGEDTVSCLSAKEAIAGLEAASLKPDEWRVNTRVCDVEVSGQLIPFVQVDIRRHEDSSGCILCLPQYLGAGASAARALFAVEGAC
jgi:hypothetical protein